MYVYDLTLFIFIPKEINTLVNKKIDNYKKEIKKLPEVQIKI